MTYASTYDQLRDELDQLRCLLDAYDADGDTAETAIEQPSSEYDSLPE